MIHRRLKLGWLAAWCAFIAVLAGCANRESSGDSSAGGGKTYRIAVIPKGTTHVFWKSVHAGALKAAREIGKLTAGKGNAILLRYNVGSESTEQRERGFLETLKNAFPGIAVLSEDQYSGTTALEAQNKALQLLNQFGDRVNAMFAVCEPDTMGVLAALEQEGLAGKVQFIGFDPGPQLIPAMAERKIHGLVLQDPLGMGYLSVKALVEHLRGEPVEKRVPTGEVMATPDNMKDPEIKKLLEPEQAD